MNYLNHARDSRFASSENKIGCSKGNRISKSLERIRFV